MSTSRPSSSRNVARTIAASAPAAGVAVEGDEHQLVATLERPALTLLQDVRHTDLSTAALWGGVLSTAFAVMQFLFGPVIASGGRVPRRDDLLGYARSMTAKRDVRLVRLACRWRWMTASNCASSSRPPCTGAGGAWPSFLVRSPS